MRSFSHLAAALMLMPFTVGCASSGAALRSTAVPPSGPLGATGLAIAIRSIETEGSWTLHGSTQLERRIAPSPGELLVVIVFEIRDAATGQPDVRRSFGEFLVEDDDGRQHVSPLQRSNVRAVPVLVPVGAALRFFRIDGVAIDVRAASTHVPAGRFAQIGSRVGVEDRVRVTTAAGRTTGNLRALTESVIVIDRNGRVLEFQCDEVLRIERVADSVASGATIGAALSLVPGMVTYGFSPRLLIGMGLYGGIGALLDSANGQRPESVYIAGEHACAAPERGAAVRMR